MATEKDFRNTALSFEGTMEAPHMDRTAFKVERIYATLAADGLSVNFKLTPDEQELKCLTHPDGFSPVPKGWGRMGWTTATLAELDAADLKAVIELAWRHALPKKRTR